MTPPLQHRTCPRREYLYQTLLQTSQIYSRYPRTQCDCLCCCFWCIVCHCGVARSLAQVTEPSASRGASRDADTRGRASRRYGPPADIRSQGPHGQRSIIANQSVYPAVCPGLFSSSLQRCRTVLVCRRFAICSLFASHPLLFQRGLADQQAITLKSTKIASTSGPSHRIVRGTAIPVQFRLCGPVCHQQSGPVTFRITT